MGCKRLKIGVFFDGTGNNEKFDSSNGRDQQSNVAKLHRLYKQGEFECEAKQCKVKARAYYIKGIGTYDTQEEYDKHWIARKYDKGGGGGGGKRIEEAIALVCDFLDKNTFGDKKEQFRERTIDVFGFSRGSALARDFVNTFTEYRINSKKKYQDVRFNFIGIFDTVGSFGKPGNAIDMKSRFPELFDEDDVDLTEGNISDDYGIVDHNRSDEILTGKKLFKTKQEAQAFAQKLRDKGADATVTPYFPPTPYGAGIIPTGYEVTARIKEYDKHGAGAFVPFNFNLRMQSAKKIVHMTAHDEVRKNFPLTNIKGSGGLETSMLGVHSDIGGGYPPTKMERHKFPYKGHYSGVQKAAEAHARKLSGMGGIWRVEKAVCARNGRGYYILLRKVINDLSNVTLHLMYEEAIKHDVPFKAMPNDHNHTITPELQGYYDYAKSHLVNAYTYESTKEGAYLEATQRHHSSADPAGKFTHYLGDTTLKDAWKKDSADGGGNDARYVDRYGHEVDGREHPELADHVQRAIYDNRPQKAIIPKEA